MNYLFKSLLMFTACLYCSCITPGKYSPVNTYDLGHIKQSNIKLNIGSIDQNIPYNSKMVYRVTEQKLELNEFDRWAQSPDLILTNFFKKAFRPTNGLSLEGEIIAFENDLTSGEALLTFQYKITQGGRILKEGIYSGREASSPNSADFAKAMSKLANKLVQVITEKTKG